MSLEQDLDSLVTNLKKVYISNCAAGESDFLEYAFDFDLDKVALLTAMVYDTVLTFPREVSLSSYQWRVHDLTVFL